MSHLTHLRTFLEIYRARSITQAARHLGITQPAASLHVQALESLVGRPLFERLPRGVEPTDAADELARAVAPYLDGLEARISALRPGQEQPVTVHLAGPADFLHCQLAPHLGPLLAQGYRLRLHPGNRKRIYELLESGGIDFAVTASMPDEQSQGFAHLLTERMQLVYAPSLTPRLGHDPTPEQLSREPLLAFDEDLPLVRLWWTATYQLAPQLQAALTMPDLRMLKDLVLAGNGWTVLPDYQCANEIAAGTLVSPTAQAEAPSNVLYLAWNKRVPRSTGMLFVRDFLLGIFRGYRR